MKLQIYWIKCQLRSLFSREKECLLAQEWAPLKMGLQAKNQEVAVIHQ